LEAYDVSIPKDFEKRKDTFDVKFLVKYGCVQHQDTLVLLLSHMLEWNPKKRSTCTTLLDLFECPKDTPTLFRLDDEVIDEHLELPRTIDASYHVEPLDTADFDSADVKSMDSEQLRVVCKNLCSLVQLDYKACESPAHDLFIILNALSFGKVYKHPTKLRAVIASAFTIYLYRTSLELTPTFCSKYLNMELHLFQFYLELAMSAAIKYDSWAHCWIKDDVITVL
jgi:hypothetical protein